MAAHQDASPSLSAAWMYCCRARAFMVANAAMVLLRLETVQGELGVHLTPIVPPGCRASDAQPLASSATHVGSRAPLPAFGVQRNLLARSSD